VFTASEIKEQIRNGTFKEEEVDVVSCGTFGVMSGTLAALTVPVADVGTFKKADTITLNGVPASPGPCPNEDLGIVDCIVNGTSHRDHRYGGGHLFRDLVEGKDIHVSVTSDGEVYERFVKLDDIPFARMIVIRGGFKNYNSFINPTENDFETIFAAGSGLHGPLKEITVSGCGEINPLENDPERRYIQSGAPLLINGSRGIIIGPGSRSNPARPNLSAAANMKWMIPELMGGFITSQGPECLTSMAMAIPIVDKRSVKGISVLDENIELSISDIRTRAPIEYDNYGSVWSGTDWSISVSTEDCIGCGDCIAAVSCPLGAISHAKIDAGKCMNCGTCVGTCVGKIFSGNLGEMTFGGRKIPISLRQSDRLKGERISHILKDRVVSGKWSLNGCID
jgi:putative methanogenesis marker 16 metalloprotein